MSITDLLMPSGVPVGEPGSSPDIREVTGGHVDAEAMFVQLTRDGTVDASTSHPRLVRLPGGGSVGYRAIAKNNGPPTIDVNIPGIPIRKIKFV